MTKNVLLTIVVLIAAAALLSGVAAPDRWQNHGFSNAALLERGERGGEGEEEEEEGEEETREFDEAEVFFEYNATDQDLGIQIFFDAVGWEEVEVTGPDGTIFEVENGGGLKQIGSTEVFTESAEPPLDEENLAEAIAAFLAMFPEGEYEFEGETVDGHELEGSAILTHNLPEMVELNLDSYPFIEWNGNGPDGVEGESDIIGYEVIAEIVAEIDEEEFVFVNTANFPASQTSYTVAPEFVDLGDALEASGELLELKVEVIVREASGNKTITEEAIFEAEEE